MPDFDFDAYNHDDVDVEHEAEEVSAAEETTPIANTAAATNTSTAATSDEVDKW